LTQRETTWNISTQTCNLSTNSTPFLRLHFW